MIMESPGQWLEKALIDLSKRIDTGFDLDNEIISGLVSYCDLAHPQDAKEYLDNIIGVQAGKSVITEYLQRRGYSDPSGNTSNVPTSKLQAYVKPPSDEGSMSSTKKSSRTPKDAVTVSSYQENRGSTESSESKNTQKGNQNNSKKKKSGKVISLAEAAKGAIIFQKGKPCSCQALRHKLVTNCLSCGKIVCEQEGEGPCSFCGALVLKEGSSYAGLEESLPPLSETEAAAEAYAKRLVDYDRNSAARTTVIDDQSDYYEFEGNSWLSVEEKELLKKKRQEIEEAEQAKRNRVVVTFDLVGRKVLLNEDEASELQSENRILHKADEREVNRIKPNPNLRVQPMFIDLGSSNKHVMSKQPKKGLNGLISLEITGRVQHENNDVKHFIVDRQSQTSSDGQQWQTPSVNTSVQVTENSECSVDYH